jgi:hypothetical protein
MKITIRKRVKSRIKITSSKREYHKHDAPN